MRRAASKRRRRARAEMGRLRPHCGSFVPGRELLELLLWVLLGWQLRNIDLILLVVVWFKYFQTGGQLEAVRGRETGKCRDCVGVGRLPVAPQETGSF